MKIIMIKGLPGSGKSTWAKHYLRANPGTVRINNDDIQKMLFDREFVEGEAKTVDAVRNAILEGVISRKKDILIDNTNLHPKHEIYYKAVATQHKYEFLIQDFTRVPIETCIERDAKRYERTVGEDVIRNMHKQMLEWNTKQNH
jgi:predicted kinase